MTCEKHECFKQATMQVILDAADGSMEWWACYDHAVAFRRWVMEETNRQGEHWASCELTWITPDPPEAGAA